MCAQVFDAVNLTQAVQASSSSLTLALQGYHSDPSHAGMQLVIDIFTADGAKQTMVTGNASAWRSNNADKYFNPSKETTSKGYGQPLENINEEFNVPGERKCHPSDMPFSHPVTAHRPLCVLALSDSVLSFL